MTSEHVASILQTAYDELIEACRRSYPREACGVLARSEASGSIDIVIPIANAHQQPLHSFSFDPVQWTDVFFSMQKNRQQLVGFFHSHPSSDPFPSLRDAEGFIPQSEQLTYWVVSLLDWNKPLIQPYQHAAGRFEPLPLVLA